MRSKVRYPARRPWGQSILIKKRKMNIKQKGKVIFLAGLIQSVLVSTLLAFEVFQLLFVWERWVGPIFFLVFWFGVILMILGAFIYFHERKQE